jgi:hypothetical protein
LNQLDDIGAGGPACLADLVLLHLKAGVVSTMPVNDRGDHAVCHIDDNLRDQRANNLLARFDGDTGPVPGTRQVLAQDHKSIAIGNAQTRLGRGVELCQLLFERTQRHQPLIPSPFEISCDKPVLWIGRIVLAVCACGLEAGLLDRVLDLPPLVRLFPIQGGQRGQCRLDPERLNAIEDLPGNSTIDPHAAEAYAAHLGPLAKRTTARVALRI